MPYQHKQISISAGSILVFEDGKSKFNGYAIKYADIAGFVEVLSDALTVVSDIVADANNLQNLSKNKRNRNKTAFS
jgi:hypothetical protein